MFHITVRSLSHNSQVHNDQKTFELVYATKLIKIRRIPDKCICMNLFLEKASCIKLLFYILWVTERAAVPAVPAERQGRVRGRLCSALTAAFTLCVTHTSYFTFSSFDSMYPLRSESYFRQAWSRKVNGQPEIITRATLYNNNYFVKSIQETLKDRLAPGCHPTRCKYRICPRWIPKCLQRSLMLSSRKLCSIYNVWRSENSFSTESSLNTVASLKMFLNTGPSFPAVSTLALREEHVPDATRPPH